MHFNKITIYIYFAIKLCFLNEKLNKSSFLWHRRDRQYASNNEAPSSNPDGRALEAEPDGFEVEDLRWVLVRVDLTNWEIRLIHLIFMLWHYWLYISGIRDVGQTFSSPNIDVKNQELLYSHRKGTRASSLLPLSLVYTYITVHSLKSFNVWKADSKYLWI